MSARFLFDACVAGFVMFTLGLLGEGGVLASLTAGTIALGCQALASVLFGFHHRRWRLASFDEAVALVATAAFAATSLVVIDLTLAPLAVTRVSAVVAPFVALNVGMLARGARRIQIERRNRPDVTDMTPVIVFGAGDAGQQIVRRMLTTAQNDYLPVAIIDDDRSKSNLRLHGVPVVGTRADLMEVSRRTGAEILLVAIPSAGASVIRVVAEQARRANLDVRVLPPTQEIVDGRAELHHFREVSEADLLGRRAIQTDVDAIAGYLEGRRVLVTGAGGSIGSELCRQISRFGPDRLVMLDRDESALHGVQLSLEGHALLDSPNLVVADIRDGARLLDIFEEHDPDVVFHAAALKHLPLLEMHPEEGWKTNVLGTQNVLRASARAGVRHFVNVSTDKAADPTSVLGYTKRIAEQLTAWYAHRSSGDWVSVRFGNVLGSRGSMLGTFRAQIAAGGPVTVTHPQVTRFFMTPVEACQLVIQAAAIGAPGEALVLDMGEPVRILEVAERLIEASGLDVEIVFTGLRPGEKLHEALVSANEIDTQRAHPLISHVAVPVLRPEELSRFDPSSAENCRESMQAISGAADERRLAA